MNSDYDRSRISELEEKMYLTLMKKRALDFDYAELYRQWYEIKVKLGEIR